MKDKVLFDGYASATVLSSAANYIMNLETVQTRTYRTYIKPRAYGSFKWKIWHSNAVDSSWEDGSVYKANLSGGEWEIEEAYIADGGIKADGSILPDTQIQLTFEGNKSKKVLPHEKFFSDAVELSIEKDHYLVFTWTITNKSLGKVIPYNCESTLAPSFSAEGKVASEESSTYFIPEENVMVIPSLILYDKPATKNIGFIGDSITQGVRTKRDKYEYWVSRIAEGLDESYGVWNIGSGWARAKDIATDGVWLYKAKQNDEIIICIGVNDIGTLNSTSSELISNVTKIIDCLKESNPSCKITLCTVPPFNFQGEQEIAWREANKIIRSNTIAGVDRVFDIAAVLSEDSPRENLLKPEYHSENYDAHPNGIAGVEVGKKFFQ